MANAHIDSTITKTPAYTSIKNAANYLYVSEDTIRRMIRRRELEAYRVGRVYRIPWTAIEAALVPAVA